MSSVPERGEVGEEYTWDLGDLFESDEAWEQAYEEAAERIEDLQAYEGRVTEDAETLLAALECREEVMRRVENVASYARMRRDEDTTDQEAQAMADRGSALSSQASSAASFIEPEIQKLDRGALDNMMEAEPALEQYDHYFDETLRMKEHTRSAEVEEILADLGEVLGAPGESYNMLTNADLEFPTVEDPEGEEIEITLSNFGTLQKRPDREFRQRVYETFYDEWTTVRNTVGATYRNSVKTDVKHARIRDYDSAREASLDSSNIPVDVYDTLVETVEDNLDLLHRHADLKRDRLDVDTLKMWDLYTPLTEAESPTVEYEEAKEHIIDAVAPLGADYQERLSEGLESRWVDVFETKNKRSGAYSGGTYESQPYILMNYQEDISSMFTLAHELGHSMHTQLASETQPYIYGDYVIFTAEVASMFNETLLTHHLLETVEDERFRRHVLDEYLERFRTTLFRQTMFADFEQQTHELAEQGEALTPDRLDDIYGDLKATYYEPAETDERIAREWMRIPHFYSAFYVYQYSTGISAAVALAKQVLEEGEPAAARYLNFLRSGSSEYPLELLRDAGVDMTEPDAVEAALTTYEEYLDRFTELT